MTLRKIRRPFHESCRLLYFEIMRQGCILFQVFAVLQQRFCNSSPQQFMGVVNDLLKEVVSNNDSLVELFARNQLTM